MIDPMVQILCNHVKNETRVNYLGCMLCSIDFFDLSHYTYRSRKKTKKVEIVSENIYQPSQGPTIILKTERALELDGPKGPVESN